MGVTAHMLLRSTAAQQVDEGSVEGHDGISYVDDVIFFFIFLE